MKIYKYYSSNYCHPRTDCSLPGWVSSYNLTSLLKENIAISGWDHDDKPCKTHVGDAKEQVSHCKPA